MANIKSAAKRAQIAKVRTLRNKSAMSKVKTTIKGVEAAVAANDVEAAKAARIASLQLWSRRYHREIFRDSGRKRT